MSALTSNQALSLINAAFAAARAKGYKPMGVVVVDAAGQIKAAAREDGASALRIDIASGKACAAVGIAFAGLIALGLCAGYALLGACWLLMKTEGALKQQAAQWAYRALWFTGLGIAAVSLATPYASPRIFAKWFVLPNLFLLAPIARGRKGEYDTMLQDLAAQGFVRAKVDGEVVDIAEFLNDFEATLAQIVRQTIAPFLGNTTSVYQKIVEAAYAAIERVEAHEHDREKADRKTHPLPGGGDGVPVDGAATDGSDAGAARAAGRAPTRGAARRARRDVRWSTCRRAAKATRAACASPTAPCAAGARA